MGESYVAPYVIPNIPLLSSAPEDFRRYRYLNDMEDSIILRGEGNNGGSFHCSQPIDKEYQIEQTIVFVTSNIVKNSLIGNSTGKILKTIVTGN